MTNAEEGSRGKEPDAWPTKRQGGADGQRLDVGLDTGSLTMNHNAFIGAIAQANAVAVLAISGILDLAKSSEKSAHLERETAAVGSTASESILSHTAGDATGHQGHFNPTVQGAARSVGPEGDDEGDDEGVSNVPSLANLLKQAATAVEAAEQKAAGVSKKS